VWLPVYMPAKTKKKAKQSTAYQELDSTYILKIVIYLIVGSQWLRLTDGVSYQIPLPIGLMVGLLFARHEHLQIDRKIEYAFLLLATFIGFWLPIGINVLV
jgi:hypothetical protein